MKLFVYTYNDGTITFGNGEATVKFTRKEVTERLEFEMEEQIVKDILLNPDGYELKEDKVVAK